MNKGGSQKLGGITLTTHAVHSCGILNDGKIIYGGEAAGYVVRLPDGRAFYFAGDTNVFSDMQLIEQLYHYWPNHFARSSMTSGATCWPGLR
jgi:L-ascorbate metabolism protein UlaG (beta-lactamase superfamily)